MITASEVQALARFNALTDLRTHLDPSDADEAKALHEIDWQLDKLALELGL
jgi:hypothetical protein